MTKAITPLTPGIAELLSKKMENGSLPSLFTREIFLLDIVVAGTTYCKNIDELREQIDAQTILELKRDPENEHDEHAIGCYLGIEQVGWVPRHLNLVISRLMDAGKAFFARVQKVEMVNDWTKISAKIYMIE